MNTYLRNLLLYQDYDIRRLNLDKQRLDILGRISSINLQCERESLAIKDLASQLKSRKALIQNRSVELRIIDDKIDVLKRKSDHAVVKAQIDAITAELELRHREKFNLEEQLLEEMMAAEAMELSCRDGADKVSLMRGKVASELDELNGQLTAVEEDISSVETMLSRLQGNIQPALLRNYERVRASSARPPYVVPLEGVICSGCHMKSVSLAAEFANSEGQQISTCDFCGRMIYNIGDEQISDSHELDNEE